MASVDYHAVVDSMKVLGIIFIITIFLSSVCLLIKLMHKNILNQPGNVLTLRRLMLIVLTCGTTLFSLFPLVVKTRMQYEESYFHTSCKTLVLSSVYENFFFPFVYAIGLLVLGAELYMTKRNPFNTPSVALRFICVSFPWVFGCILVLPLTMAGINWSFRCTAPFSKSRSLSIIWICNLIPAIAVLLVAIFLAFQVGGDDNDYLNHPSVSYSSSTQRVVHSSSSSSSHGGGFQQAANPPVGSLIPTAPQISQQRPDSSLFQQPPYDYGIAPPPYSSCSFQPHQPHHHQSQPYQYPLDSVKQQQHHTQQPPPPYPPPPPPNYAPPPPGFGTPYYEYDHNAHLQNHHMQSMPQSQSFSQHPAINNSLPVTSTLPRTSNLLKEAKVFAIVTALFVFCSVPQAIFNVAYLMNEDRVEMDDLSEKAIGQFVSWLSVLRWLLLNICWFLSFKA